MEITMIYEMMISMEITIEKNALGMKVQKNAGVKQCNVDAPNTKNAKQIIQIL